jgi:Asp-tRNA(Asn)/Glu-tRNA(Gln) amidotransferase A subunit family amidase
MTILRVEAAAAFEELTLTDRDDELKWQAPQAWPNFFRQARFAPGIEYVQAQRLRRQVMEMMAGKLSDVDAVISPSFAGSLLMITNHTGHPSLTLRCGFRDDGTPRGITLWGRLFDEGTLCRLGMALEARLNVWGQRPPM